MSSRILHLAAPAAFLLAAFGLSGSASALTIAECSAQYQAAKAAGTLAGQSWNDYRKSVCAPAAATPAAAAAPAVPAQPVVAAPAAPAVPAKPVVAAPAAPVVPAKPVVAVPAAPAAIPAPAAAATAAAVFPAAIAAQYASLKPGKARESTCLDQYKANKASNSNGGLTWIQKGGGYYSQCNKKLKGE